MDSRNAEKPLFWNYVNSDEGRLEDYTRPRDRNWFRITPWSQMEKLNYGSAVKNFYLEQITAVWGKEIAWAGTLVDTVIPLSSWGLWYNWLPYTTYWLTATDMQKKWSTYTKWTLKWSFTNDWGLIIPTGWSYFIKFYAEVFFDPNIWSTSFMVSLLNKDKEVYDRGTKVSATNPDVTGNMTLQDLKAGDVLYLGWAHASWSWKKALYVWTIIIFKLS